jgi:hypothetical protein
MSSGARAPTWRTVNISHSERLGRVLVGIDMFVTGATGHCPLYKRLGHVPRSLRAAR